MTRPSWIPRGVQAEMWWRKFSAIRAFVWLAAIPVAMWLGWVYSVAFVAACSLYANVASDVSAWRSDVNPQLDRIERRLDRVDARLERIEEALARIAGGARRSA